MNDESGSSERRRSTPRCIDRAEMGRALAGVEGLSFKAAEGCFEELDLLAVEVVATALRARPEERELELWLHPYAAPEDLPEAVLAGGQEACAEAQADESPALRAEATRLAAVLAGPRRTSGTLAGHRFRVDWTTGEGSGRLDATTAAVGYARLGVVPQAAECRLRVEAPVAVKVRALVARLSRVLDWPYARPEAPLVPLWAGALSAASAEPEEEWGLTGAPASASAEPEPEPEAPRWGCELFRGGDTTVVARLEQSAEGADLTIQTREEALEGRVVRYRFGVDEGEVVLRPSDAAGFWCGETVHLSLPYHEARAATLEIELVEPGAVDDGA